MADERKELATVVLLWLLSLITLYSPLLAQGFTGEARAWMITLLLTFVMPQFLNLVARSGKPFERFATDYNFIFAASLSTFLLFIAYLQSNAMKSRIEKFGKDIKSTGITLGLLIPTFIISLAMSYQFFGGAIYVHYI